MLKLVAFLNLWYNRQRYYKVPDGSLERVMFSCIGVRTPDGRVWGIVTEVQDDND